MSILVSPRTLASLPLAEWLKRHAVLAYWILALVISWLIWLPLIVQAQGWANFDAPFALHYLAAFGPMIAAVVMTTYVDGTTGLRGLWERITRWRVGWRGWFAAALPLVLFVLALIVTRILGNPEPDLRQLGQANYLPYLGLGVIPLWIATNGLGEEIGWRGYALPHLQKAHSALGATLILGIMWALWHLPIFFYLESYRRLGLGMFPMFALGLVAGAVILTWLFNSTGGSILMVALWHAMFNAVTATQATDVTMQTVMSIAIMVIAVFIVIIFKPANLSREPKQVA
jgi:membrane protease YdiL (CAAX protease family)